MKKIFYLLCFTISLTACDNAYDRLKNIGKTPELNKLTSPMEKADYAPVKWEQHDNKYQANNQKTDTELQSHKNSLWKAGARTFFRDQKARRVGDILKVSININDAVNMDNKTEHIRSNKSHSDATNLFGIEANFKKAINKAIDPTNLLNLNENDDLVGEGKITRSEAIKTQIAAIVTQILPNGNLVINGHQEIRVNYEIREVKVEGIVRPEDITSENIINSDLIAEARISYGGRGNITNLQQPRYGNQVLDVISPF
jgi:flagellar L-ring protein precursor FlgH